MPILPKIVLASASPRRSMLMRQANIPFEAIPADIDEAVGEDFHPSDIVGMLSEKKAAHVCQILLEPALVIAADTVVSVDGKILGKPLDGREAHAMLSMLQGKKHVVYTGVTLMQSGCLPACKKATFVDAADVYMRPLTDRDIDRYVGTGEPFDKAGAYAIQDRGALLVERVDGDYHTVVGLPLCGIYKRLLEWGIDITGYWLS